MRTTFDTEARIAVAQAADIARELGHRQVGPGHVLAGLLANPRGTAYAELRARGLDYDAARDMVAQHHVDPEPDATTDADGVDTYAEDREALKAIGIDLDRVRQAVRDNLGTDLADGWGERPGRERRRGRGGPGGRGGHGHHDHDHDHDHDHHEHEHEHRERGRGRRGPRSRRDGLRFSRSLRSVLGDARRGTGLTGPGLLEALDRSQDPTVRLALGGNSEAPGSVARA